MENKQSEIAVISQNIETGLKAFEARKEELTAKIASYKDLTIKDADDKQGFTAVSAARKDLKAERVQIEKEGKSMRDPLTGMSKMIKSKEDELVNLLADPETKFEVMEKSYMDNIAIIKQAAEKAERDRIQGMYDELKKYNFPVSLGQLTNISDEHYQEALTHAKNSFEAAEEKRLAAEKIEEQNAQIETARLQQEREEMARIKEQQDKTASDQKEAQDKIDAENKRLADKKSELEAKQKDVVRSKRTEELKPYLIFIRDYIGMLDMADDQYQKEFKELKIGAEQQWEHDRVQNKKRLDDDAAKKEQDRLAKENRDKIAAEKKARLAPDREKFINFANQLSTIASVKVQFKNKESQDLFESITNELSAMADDIKDKAEKL